MTVLIMPNSTKTIHISKDFLMSCIYPSSLNSKGYVKQCWRAHLSHNVTPYWIQLSTLMHVSRICVAVHKMPWASVCVTPLQNTPDNVPMLAEPHRTGEPTKFAVSANKFQYQRYWTYSAVISFLQINSPQKNHWSLSFKVKSIIRPQSN